MYRILTEDVNRDQLLSLVDESFEAYTAIPAIGSWRGHREQSLALEFETEDEARVLLLAERIRKLNHQESVLVQIVGSEPHLVSAPTQTDDVVTVH